jgi:hypothetical protein
MLVSSDLRRATHSQKSCVDGITHHIGQGLRTTAVKNTAQKKCQVMIDELTTINGKDVLAVCFRVYFYTEHLKEKLKRKENL